MNELPYPPDWPEINIKLYKRSINLIRGLKNMLSVQLKLHADHQVPVGDIFLFNHFSRFETFIPQFLIYEKTGSFSCAIASSEFFNEDNVLSRYLKHVGVYPHNHPRLFPLLAGQILKGRKIIIFPEGGMIKDRRVIDKAGESSIFSRISGTRRKQHTGAAVLGQGVEAIKIAIRYAHQHNQTERLLHWKEQLKFDNIDQLIAAVQKPTLIIPANITFYPIRSSDNLLYKSVELFTDGLSLRQSEELLIEGNILLKNTDMDIRMGNPIDPCDNWEWRTRFLMNHVAPTLYDLDDIFNLGNPNNNWQQQLLNRFLTKSAEGSRNQYTRQIYANVTINLSHLASTLIMYFISQGQTLVEKSHFYGILYIAIKRLQNNMHINLHRSLVNPDDYSDYFKANNFRFTQFIEAAKAAELVQERNNSYQFLPKLLADFDFDRIRLENPIAVYNNEAAPLSAIKDSMIAAIEEYSTVTAEQLASWHFDDECRGLAWEKHVFNKPQYDDINQQETAVADPAPFFIHPEQGNGLGILLIHGLLASPAELRDYGEYLANQGYIVLGIRLKGHGTSPYALREQHWQDWYGSVQRGFAILTSYCAHIFVIGFSTGGALAIKLAHEQHHQIVGIVAASVPIKFVDPAFMLVPFLHGTNKLIEWLSSIEGLKPFIDNAPEHPTVNYQNVPVRALYELRMLIEHIDNLLPTINTPTLVIYGDNDPVVSAKSSLLIFDRLGTSHKRLEAIASARHGILMENINNTWGSIDEFLQELTQQALAATDGL
jgi:esterase/lipase